MIKFFRQIRQNLLMENKTGSPEQRVRAGKYLKYAIGEIVLVVIGILIALQINNYNESRKADKLSQQYLIGIQNDLKKDIELIDQIIQEYTLSFSLIQSIDSVFNEEIHQKEKYSSLFTSTDTSQIQTLFYRSISFRPVKGTYNSLIADGKSGAIKNRLLFQKFQEIYDEENLRIASTYETIKVREAKIEWAYPFEKRNWTYSDLKNAKNDKIFLDLSNFTEQKYFYARNLYDVKEIMLEALELMKNEIN